MSPTISEDELGAYFALRRASDRLTRAVTTQLKQFGLTEVQFTILAELGRADDGLAMSQIAKAIVGSKSGLTYQVDRLQERGLVARATDANDERRTPVALTDEGRHLMQNALSAHIALVRTLFLDHLDEIDAAALRRTLEAVAP